MDFNQSIFTINYDVKGFPFITKDILANRVEESAELTTSPNGVMTKFFVNYDNELRKWGANGRSYLIQSFDNYKDARQAWLEEVFIHDYSNSELWLFDHFSYEKAVCAISEELEISCDTVLSLLKHHELYRQLESKIAARKIMKRFYTARENADGRLTKKLEQAMNAALYPCCYMYGRTYPYDGQRLDIEDYLTDDFRKDLFKTQSEFLKYYKR